LKRRVVFRTFPFNRLSFPTLLNSWERENLDSEFEILISDKIVQPNKGDVFVYSFMTPFLPIIYDEIKKINNKDIIIIGGGSHITGDTELPFNMGFDILFTGNAEKSFSNFAVDLIDGKIEKKQKIYKAKPFNINDYLPISKYFKTLPPLEITRGCFWNCKYCQTNINSPDYRSPKSIKSYFEYAKLNNINRINFISPSGFEYNSKKIGKNSSEDINKLLKTAKSYGFKFIEYGIFPSEIRPNSINEEDIKMLRQYVSNKRLTIGAQSGDDSRLRKLNRGHTISDIENSIKIINKYKFIANIDFIIGYPDETEYERIKTFDFIQYLHRVYRVKIQFHYFFPLSGSKLQDRFPTKLSPRTKEKLLKMNRDGLIKNGWVQNEINADNYFKWLKNTFPDFYKRYI